MASYMEQRKAFIKQGFDVGIRAGRQQILDMMSLVLRDPEIMGKDIFGKDLVEHLQVLVYNKINRI